MSSITAGSFTAGSMTAARSTGFRTPAPVAAPAVTRTRLRITARGRAVLSVLVALPFIVAILLAVLNGGVAVADQGGSTVTVTVSAGQTLWSLAEAIAPGSNPADVVADIVAVNALDGGAVQAGQTLVLPAAYAD
jgi:hypothetical protein